MLKVLQHVNQRYKSQPTWKLPTDALLKLLQTLPKTNVLTCNFAVGYVLSSLSRDTVDVKRKTLLSLMGSFAQFNEPCQQHVLSAFVFNIGDIRIKAPLEIREADFAFASNEATKRAFLAYATELLLWTPRAPAATMGGGMNLNFNAQPVGDNLNFLAPGHSVDSQTAIKTTPLSAIQAQLPDAPTIITQVGSYSLQMLTERKVQLVSFLRENVDVFSDLDLYLPSIIASTDILNDVQHVGEDLHRKLSSKEALEDVATIKRMFSLFVGETASAPAPQAAQAAPAVNNKARAPASLATGAKLLELLSRSRTAPTILPQAIMVLLSGLLATHNLTHPKIQTLALVFAQQVVRLLSPAQLNATSPAILSLLSKFLKWVKGMSKTGNASQVPSPSQLESLHISCLHAISALGRRAPQVFSNNIDLIEELLNDLQDTPSVVLASALQEALTSICPTSAVLSDAAQLRLKTILAKNFEIKKGASGTSADAEVAADPSRKTSVSVRYVAQYYANRSFPFSDVFLRYINLLGTSDANNQVAQEAKIGLKPYTVVDNAIVPLKEAKENTGSPNAMEIDSASETSSSIAWPSFARMVILISEKLDDGLIMASSTFQSTITFLHELMMQHRRSRLNPPQTPGAEPFKAGLKDEFALAFYLQLLQDAIVQNASNHTSYMSAEQYLETLQLDALPGEKAGLGTIASGEALKAISDTLLSGSLKPETAKIASRIVGVLALDAPEKIASVVESSFNALQNNKSITVRDVQIGAVYALSSVVSACLRTKVPEQSLGKSLEEIVQMILSVLQASIASRTATGVSGIALMLATLDSIGFIGRWSNKAASVKTAGNDETLLQAVLSLLPSHDFSIVIQAAYCIGNLCLGDRALIADEAVLKGLLATFVVKNEEAHFSIGEALSMVAYGWYASITTDTTVHSHAQEEEQRLKQSAASEVDLETGAMKHILQVTLKEYFLSSRPDTRMASAIWLLTILKNCGAHPEVVSQLRSIQVGFQQLLGDTNEILQEVAGKALSLVYELGDESTKKELVDSLVNALQKGSSSTFKVTADSEIFATGEVGMTPTGDKLTTYRELVTLASEMNQPDLIYKFMQLSSHNALWNSKKGAAFATGELARRAKEQIAPHLPQLVPKLYRSSFDPNLKIAHSMDSILQTLVPDLKSTIQTYIHVILRDLLHNAVDPQWRTREASCAALADVLPAREWDDVKEELKDLWDRCFRVLDDIKESVRKSAEGFKKALSTLTLRLCDPSYTNRDHGRIALEIALPHLMSKGLLSSVKEVRAISLSMIQKISKVASFLLKPHISDLVPVLLSSLGSLENSAQLNYLEQHSTSLGISGDMFDEVRVSMSKNSPVHATIDTCVQQADSQNIEILGPKIGALLTSEQHVATRTAAANVITTLALTKPELTRLIAHKLMLALKKGINARAPIVRKTYGYAMGQLSRCAKKRTIEIVVTSLLDSYKQSTPEETDLRAAVAEALLELSKAHSVPIATPAPSATSTDAAPISAATAESAMDVDVPVTPTTPVQSSESPKSASSAATSTSASATVDITEGRAAVPVLAPLLPIVVPVVFIGRFDAREDTSKLFNKIWEECGASLALYVPETVAAFGVAFEASSWQMKQQGAKSLAKFAESLNFSQFAKQAPELLKMLITGLKGRTWQGKESLLNALAKLVACAIEMWSKPSEHPSNALSADDLFKVINAEITRKTLDYKKAAIVCAADVLSAFDKFVPDYDAISQMKTLLIEHATTVHVSEDSSSADASSTNNATTSAEKKDDETALSRSIRQMSIQALCAAFPSSNKPSQTANFASIIAVLKRTYQETIQYTMKVAVLNYLKTLVLKIKSADWDEVVRAEDLHLLLDSILLPAIVDPKYSVVRTAGCGTMAELLTQAEHSPELEKVIVKISESVTTADQLGQTPSSSERLLTIINRIKAN